MKRLTEWIDEDKAVQKMDMKRNGHQRCVNKLAELEDLEEQGKLMILPCNYGDYVWLIKTNFSYPEVPIKAMISYISIMENGEFFFRTNTCLGGIDRTFSSKNIGKIVFMTEQEANEALEGMKNEGNKIV